MTYQIRTLNLTKFLWTVIIGTILSVVGMIFLATQIDSRVPIILLIPLVVSLFILSQKAYGKTIEVKLETNSIKFNQTEIPLNAISGFYIDDNISMSAFNLKLVNGTIIRRTITTSGKWKAKYFDFINDFRSIIQSENPEATFLEYREVYPRSGRFINFTVYAGIPLVLAANLCALFLFLKGGAVPWQLFLANFYLLILIPYARKNKR
jgi:ABC-type multidrug transport system fused ATPase/permease subunit